MMRFTTWTVLCCYSALLLGLTCPPPPIDVDTPDQGTPNETPSDPGTVVSGNTTDNDGSDDTPPDTPSDETESPIQLTLGTIPDTVSPGDTVTLHAAASGGVGPYTFAWSATQGAVGEATNTAATTRVRWHAPTTVGPARIQLRVTDTASPDSDAAVREIGVVVIGSGIVLTPDSLIVAEGGAAKTYRVQLHSEPTAPVVVEIAADPQLAITAVNGRAATLPVRLTFTDAAGGAPWNIAQTISVAARDDVQAESTHQAVITHRSSSADPIYANRPATLSATVIDNESVGVVITPLSVKVVEGGATATYSVYLTSEPLTPVTIVVTPGLQLSLNGMPRGRIIGLTFTADGGAAPWSVPQTVTVAAYDDNVAEGAHAVTIRHEAASADLRYDGINMGDVFVSITDNEGAGLGVRPAMISVVEGASTAEYTVSLRSQPSAPVTVNVTPATDLALNGQPAGQPVSLLFTPTGAASLWSVPQTVRVAARDNTIVDGARTALITHAAASIDPFYNGQGLSNVSVYITDDDASGVIVTPSTIAASESGATETYTVRLTSEPAAPVTLTALPDGQSRLNGNAPATPVSLVFTKSTGASPWNVPQTITVAAVNDLVAEGAHVSKIVHTTTSADLNYDGLSVPDVTTDIEDNDFAGVLITPLVLKNVIEDGFVRTYTIVLATQPTGTVTVTVDPDTQLQISGNPPGQQIMLVFTPTNWSTLRTVAVVATADGPGEGEHVSIIKHSAKSGDLNYHGIAIQDVTAQIVE